MIKDREFIKAAIEQALWAMGAAAKVHGFYHGNADEIEAWAKRVRSDVCKDGGANIVVSTLEQAMSKLREVLEVA